MIQIKLLRVKLIFQAFQTQLAPFVSIVEKANSGEFKWIDGGHPATPPEGFSGYFGPPPWRRFINFDGVAALDDVLDKIREFPDGVTAEDAIRELTGGDVVYNAGAVRCTLDRLFKIIDEDPEIDVRLVDLDYQKYTDTCQGILGYSEGATVASTLVLEERRRWEEEGIPRRIKVSPHPC